MAKGIEGNKLLRKTIPGAYIGYDDYEPYITVGGGEGWTTYYNGTVNFAIWRGYFDIAGWSKEQLSAFINGVGWQESDRWTIANANTEGAFAPEVLTWDILSKGKIPDEALDGEHFLDGAGFFGWNAPGMIDSNYNLEEIFGGRFRQYLPNANLNNVANQYATELWGCGDATAGDKIYITRIVAPFLAMKGGEDATVLVVPPQAILVPAVVVDEKDLVYMERLRRSYVLGESRNP